jgi:hypothetical protein
MTDDLVKRLREYCDGNNDLMDAAADRIEWMQDIIARIQYTNLRRDINAKNRMIEIEKLCKGKKDERRTELQDS